MKNLDLEISESIKIYGSLKNFLRAMDCTDIEDYKKMRSYDFINGRICLMK